MRARLVMAAVLAVLVADCSAGCRRFDPVHPSRGPMPYTSVGDGSWTAPDELRPGLWRSREDVTAMHDCAWYTTPPARSVPSDDERGRASVVVDGRTVKSLTLYHCGTWEWVRY